jgi:transcriptional regulator GlxA family with amidase domain
VHRVVALALPEVVAFDLSIPAQVFGHVEERDRYRFTVCAERPGEVSSTTGFSITVPHGLAALEAADTVVVPGFMPTDDPPAIVSDALRLAYARGARIASVCVGAFALAAAGLMDGRAATTHWEHTDDLRRRFPEVEVRPEVLYVDDGQILSSAGISSGIDLCLHMVRSDFGADVAARVSRRMVAALHRPGGQAQFIDRPLPEGDSPIARTCAWAVDQLAERPLSVDELADHAGYSPRSFSRRFHEEVGTTPARWLAAQRVIEARRLLERTAVSIEEVAARSGLGTPANLRLHFARELSTTPTAYRQAFRATN